MRNSNRTIWTPLFVAAAFVLGFTSCEQKDTDAWMSDLIYSSAHQPPTVDDDDTQGGGNGGSENGGGSTETSTSLLLTNIPSQGWSGNSYNGVYIYVPQTDAGYYPRYYAFQMSGGVCQKAVFVNYCYTVTAAQNLYRQAYEGTYTDFNFTPSNYNSSSIQSSEYSQTDLTLPFTDVQYQNSHVYVSLDYLFKNKSAQQVQNVVNYWCIGRADDGGYNPDSFLFGSFSLNSHQLDLSNVRGLSGSTLQTKYTLLTSGKVSTFVRYFYFNQRNWARFYFDWFYSWDSGSPKLNGYSVTYTVSASGNASSWAYSQAQYDDWWYSFHYFAG